MCAKDIERKITNRAESDKKLTFLLTEMVNDKLISQSVATEIKKKVMAIFYGE